MTVAGATGNITILTYGSRGDVQPFVALGAALRGAGHTVRLAAPAAFAPLARSRDLAFEPIPGDPSQLTEAFADRAGLRWPRMAVEMTRHVRPLAAAAFRAAKRAARGADLILHSFLMTDAGHTLAELQGVPDISAQFFPVFLPTSAFSAVGFPNLPLGDAYRRATHALSTAVFRYGARWLYRRVRASAPDLPALAPWPFAPEGAQRIPIVLAYSPRVLSRPADWPPHAHVTGYWRLPVPSGWNPPRRLARFLAAGPPPVFFAPGSVRGEGLRSLVNLVVDAILARRQRLILGLPPRLAGEADLADDVFAIGDVPHAWLFLRARYILHHGGAGTTGAAVAAGVPSTAIPFSADQAFWARQIARRGLGPPSVPARRLTRARLERILDDALTNADYARRARALGREIRREDGIGNAVRIVEAHMGRPKRSD